MTILVIGAGPTGLTAAIELARQGIDVEIVDCRDGPTELSRAVGIIPNTIEILRACGAGDAIEREAMKLDKARYDRAGKTMLDINFSDMDGCGTFIFGLALYRTEFHLREALARQGLSVQYSRHVETVTNNEQSATVTFADGVEKTYDWVVAADGVHSTIRQMMGIELIGEDLEEKGFIADIEVADDIDHDTTCIYSSLQGTDLVMICGPIAKKRISIGSTHPDIMPLIEKTFTITKVHYQATFDLAFKLADRYRKGRVLLAGDSAHCTTPTDARGMNLGIDDAAAVADAIVNDTVDSYSDSRRTVGAAVIEKSNKVHNFFYKKRKSFIGGAYLLCFFVKHSKFLRRKLYRRLSEL